MKQSGGETKSPRRPEAFTLEKLFSPGVRFRPINSLNWLIGVDNCVCVECVVKQPIEIPPHAIGSEADRESEAGLAQGSHCTGDPPWRPDHGWQYLTLWRGSQVRLACGSWRDGSGVSTPRPHLAVARSWPAVGIDRGRSDYEYRRPRPVLGPKNPAAFGSGAIVHPLSPSNRYRWRWCGPSLPP